MIIYPPYIADTIPAFITNEIKIPFVINPAVGFNEIKYFSLRIYEYNSLDLALNKTLQVQNTERYCQYDETTKSGIVTFSITDAIDQQKMNTGQYYKFQLSFGDGSSIGDTNQFYAWSTASIGRCIGTDIANAPTIKVYGSKGVLSKDVINTNSVNFKGQYSTSLLSEPLYSYRFYVKNQKTNETVADTGIVLHNNDKDKVTGTKRISTHEFVLNYVLEQWVYYTITYEIVTINGYVTNITYPITLEQSAASKFKNASVIVDQDAQAKDNGYVNISISGTAITGKFELQRTSDNKQWYTLATFDTTTKSNLQNFTWKDWSVEQGVTYVYAIRQYAANNTENIEYSKRICSNPIQIEYDHMFLSDGKKQLKIAFNPKVSSIKDIILENKMDTIGSKYPFFFRNNTVRYKELPISGLLSYLADDDQLFLSEQELGLVSEDFGVNNTRTTNLTAYNFEAEKIFKLSVLNWLNNGEPKLFRSPAEGNYIVRLMNVSLSPNEQVGRMLHSFSATAYEIADNNITNLQKYKLIDLPHLSNPIGYATETITFKDLFPSTSSDNTCSVLDYLKASSSVAQKPLPNAKIVSIQWNQQVQDLTDYVKADGNIYYNVVDSQPFTTPEGFECLSLIVSRPNKSNNLLSTITITYEAEELQVARTYGRMRTMNIEEQEDEFEVMIKTAEDVLFTIPSGYYMYESNGQQKGVLIPEDETLEPVIVYQIYTLTARRDENYFSDDRNDYCLIFKDRVSGEELSRIDCSDGQIRYYSDLPEDTVIEKGLGLTVDLYAYLGGQASINSSQLGKFILSSSQLGG